MFHASFTRRLLVGAAVMVSAAAGALSQTTYRQPSPELVRLIDAPPTPMVSLAPTRDHMLLLHRVGLPPIADLAQPMLRLAGERINPATNGPHGPRRIVGLTLRSMEGVERPVKLPESPDISGVAWSHDGKRVAFTLTLASGIQGWVLEVASGEAKAVTGANLNPLSGAAMRWMPDGKTLLCRVVPKGRGPMPVEPAVPTGPVVQDADGSKAPLRTLQDMLTSAHDEALFDWLMPSELVVVSVGDGSAKTIAGPAIWGMASPSPDGKYLLTSRTVRPYSYQVGWGDFPAIVEVRDADGRVVREMAKVPLRENIPIEGVETGPRAFQWQDSAEARLFWVEALDGGDPKKKVAYRDRLMWMNAPFTGEPAEVHQVEHRFTGLDWMEGWGKGEARVEGMALVTEYDRDRRWTRTTMILPGSDKVVPKVIFDRSIRDRYNDPGRPLTRPDARGRALVLVEGESLYLRGAGASPKGERPFLDRMALADGAKERLWQCEEERYESVVDVVGWRGGKPEAVITSRESVTEPPNFFVRTMSDGMMTALTAFADPTPELRGIKKQLVKYTRDDGVPLSATLYLPPGYKAGTRLPLLVWAYPMEFNDPATAGQVSGSDKRFVQMSGISHLFLLMAGGGGYAIMDNAAMPVVGDPETMNDTFVKQIVASAKAAIDKAAEMGVADPNRVAVGGHSYGAFMTANLLAHCDLFKAGIARSGAYNRTLTPFGFQSERRTFWEAPEVYMKLSPFTHADKIKTPVLMIHGQKDNNPGTFPMQSERLFQAIKGNGGVARLVMLPHESHGYAARESALHVLAETIDWLDRYVKNAGASGSK